MKERPDRKPYPTEAEYGDFLGTYELVVPLVLFALEPHVGSIKHRILVNFAAHSLRSLQSVFLLYEAHDYQNCWVLHRCILDRLFHLYDLLQTDDFLDFFDFSFWQQVHSRNRTKSDPELRSRLNLAFFTLTDSDLERLKQLERNPPQWRRPRPEMVARKMGVPFLYTQGYDFASMAIHPMADDGAQSHFHLTNMGPPDRFPSHIAVLGNSALASMLLVHYAMDAFEMNWVAALVQYFDAANAFLREGVTRHKEAFASLRELGPDAVLCKPRNLQ